MDSILVLFNSKIPEERLVKFNLKPVKYYYKFGCHYYFIDKENGIEEKLDNLKYKGLIKDYSIINLSNHKKLNNHNHIHN
jgi:hypothetical protein